MNKGTIVKYGIVASFIVIATTILLNTSLSPCSPGDVGCATEQTERDCECAKQYQTNEVDVCDIPVLSEGTNDFHESFAFGTALAAFRSRVDLMEQELREREEYSHIPSAKKNKQARVCIVTDEYPKTGTPYGEIGAQFYQLARTLLQNDHKVKILYTNPVDWRKKSFLVDGKEMVIEALDPLEVKIDPAYFAKTQYQILKYFKDHEREFDIIHFIDTGGSGYMTQLAKFQGWLLPNASIVVHLYSPQIHTQLSNHQFPNLYSLHFNYFEKTSIELADVVVSPSYHLIKVHSNYGWKFPNKTFTINPVISTNALKSQNRDGNIQELVYFSHTDVTGAISMFIKSLEQLGSQYLSEHSISITFINQQSVHHGFITESFAKSQILQNINLKFLQDKTSEDIISYLSDNSKLAILVSFVDHSYSNVLEFIMNGVKFVATNVGGIHEILSLDSNCLFSPDFKRMSSIIKNTLDDNNYLIIKPTIYPQDNNNKWVSLHNWIIDSNNNIKNYDKVVKIKNKITEQPPLVTVCITHHERIDLLKITIMGLLEQTYKNFEIIILDDGSSAPTIQSFKDNLAPFLDSNFPSKWRFFTIANSYLGAARNHCIRKMANTSSYITFIDDDDVMKAGYLDKLVYIAEYSNADAITSFFNVFTAPPLTNPLSSNIQDHSIWAFTGGDKILPLFSNVLGGANIFMRKQLIESIGDFTTYQQVGYEDYEELTKIKLSNKIHTVVPDPMIWIRNTPNSMMKRDDPFNGDIRVITNYMDYPLNNMSNMFLLLRGLVAESTQTMPKQQAFSPLTRNIIAHSKRDFSNKQGRRNWYYGFRRFARSVELNIENTIWDYKSSRWLTTNNTLDWPYIDAISQHPSIINHVITCAVRRWISYEQGAYTATVTSEKTFLQDCGDGVDIILLIDGKVVFKRTAKSGDRVQNDININLKIGSKVDLVVDPKKSDPCDATEVELEIWENT